MKDRNCSDVVLEGDCSLLRSWRIEDATWYVESRDEEVFRWTKEKRDLKVEEAEAAIRSLDTRPDVVSYAVVDRETMEPVGNIALVISKEDRRTAEIMYWLAPFGRGRGIASDSVALLCRWAFDSLDLHRISLKTHSENTRSRLVAHRAGFRLREGQCQVRTGMLWFDLYSHMGTQEDEIR